MYLHYKHINLPNLPVLTIDAKNGNKNQNKEDIERALLKKRAQNVKSMWEKVDNYLIKQGNTFWSEALDNAKNGKFDELNKAFESCHFFQENFSFLA